MKKVNLIDVRTAYEYNLGSIPDAINIPLNEIPNRINELKIYNLLLFFVLQVFVLKKQKIF